MDLNTRWANQIQESWQKRYEHVSAARTRWAALEERSKQTKLSPLEAFQRATLAEALHGVDCAVPLYQAMLTENPNQPDANFAIGRILLSKGDFNGVPLIERAMELFLEIRSALSAAISVAGFRTAAPYPRAPNDAHRITGRLRRSEEA